MATHSSTLAWKIPWMEEPGRLQSMGLLRVEHDWATPLSLFTFMHWRRKWQPPLQCSCLENPRDGGALWASVYGVAQSWTQLKWLSSSSSSNASVSIWVQRNNGLSNKGIAKTNFAEMYGTAVSWIYQGPYKYLLLLLSLLLSNIVISHRPYKAWCSLLHLLSVVCT